MREVTTSAKSQIAVPPPPSFPSYLQYHNLYRFARYGTFLYTNSSLPSRPACGYRELIISALPLQATSVNDYSSSERRQRFCMYEPPSGRSSFFVPDEGKGGREGNISPSTHVATPVPPLMHWDPPVTTPIRTSAILPEPPCKSQKEHAHTLALPSELPRASPPTYQADQKAW